MKRRASRPFFPVASGLVGGHLKWLRGVRLQVFLVVLRHTTHRPNWVGWTTEEIAREAACTPRQARRALAELSRVNGTTHRQYIRLAWGKGARRNELTVTRWIFAPREVSEASKGNGNLGSPQVIEDKGPEVFRGQNCPESLQLESRNQKRTELGPSFSTQNVTSVLSTKDKLLQALEIFTPSDVPEDTEEGRSLRVGSTESPARPAQPTRTFASRRTPEPRKGIGPDPDEREAFRAIASVGLAELKATLRRRRQVAGGEEGPDEEA